MSIISYSMPRVLWVNPSFLDYRIPLYEELYGLYGGNFYLIYSKQRIPERCNSKIISALKSNAIFLNKEKIITTKENSDFANASVSIPFPKGLYKLIRKVNADIIISEGFFQFTPWALLYTLLHRKPLIIAYERTAHTERNCPKWRLLYRKFVNLFVSGYIVNGSLTKEYLISQGVRPDVIFTGAMCADSKELSKSVQNVGSGQKSYLKSKLNLTGKDIVYLYVGRLIERKGVEYLLQAWKKHAHNFQNDHLLIVGSGPLLSKFTTNYGGIDSITFIGDVDYSEIHQYYAISDVFIIPTLEDNWSLVVPEAMACGLPIACSIYNGCYPELVHNGENGTLFDPLKEKSVTEALSYFHSVDIHAQGERSKEIESDYSPHKTALNIRNAINGILTK